MHDGAQNRPVALKCLKNDKEKVDAGLGEARIQALIRLHDPHGRRHIVRLLDCFYYREHLFLVYERLNASVLAHYMHLETLGPCARAEYWHAGSIGALSIQMLDALSFLACLGITHCDVKTANICIVNAERRIFKLIDFGSVVLTHDAHMSYLQVSATECPASAHPPDHLPSASRSPRLGGPHVFDTQHGAPCPLPCRASGTARPR